MEKAEIDVRIVPAATDEHFERSARLLSENEPWITLGRTYEYSLQKVRDPGGELYVALADGVVAGCILIEMHGQLKGFIRSICTDGAYRGMGIGTKLMAFAEERVFRDVPNLFIFAASFNPKAKALYLRLGYEEVGVFKNYIVQGSDECLLRKTIAPANEFKAKIPL